MALPGSPSSVNRRPRGGRLSPAQILRSACFFISITGLAANHAQLAGQEVTTAAPPANAVENAPAEVLPAALADTEYPDAVAIAEPGTDISIVTDPVCGKESRSGNLYVADCHVVITYRNRVLEADHIEYNSDTGDVDMTGHVVVTIAETQERIEASHGTINLKTQMGRFFDVVGSVGAKAGSRGQGAGNGVQGAGDRDGQGTGSGYKGAGDRRPEAGDKRDRERGWRLRGRSATPTTIRFCLPGGWW